MVAVAYEKWSFTGGSSYGNVKGLQLHEVVLRRGSTIFLMCIKFKFY